jgi:2-dehydro-3-deoxyphosphogluconate aldolase / (4S)-4-hydroxy-2-oxoglutarate aldolase
MTQSTALAGELDLRLEELPAIAILRASTGRYLVAAAEVLVEEGFRVLEFPLTTPNALAAVADARSVFGDRAVVGAGTILDAADAERAVVAGAQLLVSPALCPDVVAVGHGAGLPTLPGAFTATEILATVSAGATLTKLFPVNFVGPQYLAALRQPLPELRAVPTGGVSLVNAGGWLRAGAAALGLGSPLVADTIETGNLGLLRELARTWVRAIRTCA